MSNLTPFEIRLELLKMAKDMLEQEYHAKRDALLNDWSMRASQAIENKQELPVQPDLPKFPTENEVIEKSKQLNNFISQNS